MGVESDVSWNVDGVCRRHGGLTDLFFSDHLSHIALAKSLCAGCPVLAPCLQGALRREEPAGVWGGQLFRNGSIVWHKRPRGRPPRVPRPEHDLPEVPVPVHLRARAGRHPTGGAGGAR